MMSSLYPLDAGGTTTLDANGAGTVELTVPQLESWRITRIAVLVDSNILEPTARVYVNTMSPVAFVGGTYTGSNDASDENLMLRPGQRLICHWDQGDAGATAGLSVYGEKTAVV